MLFGRRREIEISTLELTSGKILRLCGNNIVAALRDWRYLSQNECGPVEIVE